MQIDLRGKNILVTGGAGDGLGQGICEAVDQAGGRVILNDLTLEVAREAAKKYNNDYRCFCDRTTISYIREATAEDEERYGCDWEDKHLAEVVGGPYEP